MTSLQNHLRQLSGNKQNKKAAFKEGDFFFILISGSSGDHVFP